MSKIKKFLQKRRIQKANSHGMYMIVIAYVLSFILLIFGSDSLYDINSDAKEISVEAKEEAKRQVVDLSSEIEATSMLTNNLVTRNLSTNNVDKSNLEIRSINKDNNKKNLDDTQWFMGHALNDEEYEMVLSEIENMDLPEAEPEEILSLSIEDTSSPFTEEEIIMLERIVEAEATGEDMKGKILIVNVVMNRMNNDAFPDTVEGVIFQNTKGKYQFSPISDKRFWTVKVTEESKEAVQRAIDGEDYSEGALYFMARKRANKNNARWFDKNLKRLFSHGGHEFFTNKA